jgi:hypothetical protein
MRIRIRMDPHHFGNLDPHPDPHQGEKSYPDPHQGKKSDPDPHQIKIRIRSRIK